MKVNSAYWLGLGSGFILSAMLVIAITPLQGQALNAAVSSKSQPSQATQSQTPPKTSSQASSIDASIKPQNNSSSAEATPIERDFVISPGATSELIADQLVAQGLIKDKTEFLSVVNQMGVESKFREGTFKLCLGLTSEEIINRLLKI